MNSKIKYKIKVIKNESSKVKVNNNNEYIKLYNRNEKGKTLTQ